MKDTFECPKCGISREQVQYCQNPDCEDARLPGPIRKNMRNEEIINVVRQMFSCEMSPGQVFDLLVEYRKKGLTFEDVANAIKSSSDAIDVSEDFAKPAVPARAARPARRTNAAPATKFHNPELTFGKYNGKKLLEVMKINPGYVKWMADGGTNGTMPETWVMQARLAQVAAAADAPSYEDTDATGFMG